jgi:hypothetical protein
VWFVLSGVVFCLDINFSFLFLAMCFSFIYLHLFMYMFYTSVVYVSVNSCIYHVEISCVSVNHLHVQIFYKFFTLTLIMLECIFSTLHLHPV